MLHNCPAEKRRVTPDEARCLGDALAGQGNLIHDRRRVNRGPDPGPIDTQHVRGVLKFWDEFEPRDAVTTMEMRRQYVESLMAADVLLRLATLENNLDLLASMCSECRKARGLE